MDDLSKQNLAIALVTDNKYLFACGTFIINVIEKIPQASAIIIYYSDISQDDINKISQIDERIQFREYTKQKFLDEFFDGKDYVTDHFFFQRFTHLAAIKFKIFQLLEEFNQVVFFDVDMLLTDNIDFLFDKKGFNIAWKSDGTTLYKKLIMGGYKDEVNDLLMDYPDYDKIDTPNGGFFLINSDFDYKYAYEIGKRFCIQACKYHPNFIDEQVFAYIAYKLNLKIYNVDGVAINATPPWHNKQSKLVHFMQQFKPWSYDLVQLFYPDWLRNYNIFTQKTGLSTNIVKNYSDIGVHLIEDMLYDYWQLVLKKIIFPKELYISHNLKNYNLRLYVNRNIFFDITKVSMADKGSILLYINRSSIKDKTVFDNIYKEIINKYTDIVDCRNEKFYKCKISTYEFPNLQERFDDFYDKVFFLTKCTNTALKIKYFKKIYLKTFFGKYLCINGQKICQTIDHNLAIESYITDKKIVFKVPNNNLFINLIEYPSYITTSSEVFFFDCEYLEDKIAIKVDNMYLSARNDKKGKVSLMPHCKEWELFICQYL